MNIIESLYFNDNFIQIKFMNPSNTTNKRKSKSERKYKCEVCDEKSKVFRVFDVDGTNLIEALVCLNCRDGELPTKSKSLIII